MINFVGNGIKLTEFDVSHAAIDLGVDAAVLQAVIAVETSGSGFDKQNRPKALFERHIFYRHLVSDPDKLQTAVDKGLAYPKWGQMPYPKTSDGVYLEIIAACEIDEEAALMSTSWGLGQVMGDNYRIAGCSTIEQMVEEAVQSESNQLHHMVSYIMATGLADELQSRDWAGFAKHYNGPAYQKNQYDVKLAEAYEKFA